MTRTVFSSWMRAILISCLLLTPLAHEVSAESLVYTPSPIESSETVIANHSPLAACLAKGLGQSVRIFYKKNHTDIIHLFQNKKIDLVQLGPLPYVKLRDQYPQAVPLALFREADGRPAYPCVLVTAFDGPHKVEELHGAIAMVQPLSTCGPLSVDYFLNQHGKNRELIPHEFLGNQDNVALAVIRGEYAAGGVKSSIAAKYASLALRVIAETPPFPGLVLVGNGATLSLEQLEAIRSVLLAMAPERCDGLIEGKYGFAPVTDEDFQVTRDFPGFER